MYWNNSSTLTYFPQAEAGSDATKDLELCQYCGGAFKQRGMKRHLNSCAKKREADVAASATQAQPRGAPVPPCTAPPRSLASPDAPPVVVPAPGSPSADLNVNRRLDMGDDDEDSDAEYPVETPVPVRVIDDCCPCPICLKEVTYATGGIQCDGCDGWWHLPCVGKKRPPPEHIEWHCRACLGNQVSPPSPLACNPPHTTTTSTEPLLFLLLFLFFHLSCTRPGIDGNRTNHS